MTTTVAQRLVDQLVVLGAELAFGVPGESYLAVLNALHDTPSLRYVTCRQESGAAFAAEAYGKLGEPALVHGITHTPRLVVFGGGEPVRVSGELVGAVGVSGGSAEQDAEIAAAGAAALS